MSNQVIQSMWIGKIGTIERLSIASYVKNNHPYHLYSYGEPDGKIPDGVEVKDANDIVPKHYIGEFRTLQQFSDYFRWNLLYKHGGFWCDCDTVCLRPLDFTESTVLVEEELPGCGVRSIAWALREQDLRDIEWEGGRFIGNGYVKFSAGSDVLKYMINECNELRPKWKSLPWVTLGPALITRTANLFRLRSLPYTVLQPIPGYLAHLLIDPNTVIPDSCFAVHFWKSAWNSGTNSSGVVGKLDSEATYNPECPFEVLKRKYLGLHKITNGSYRIDW